MIREVARVLVVSPDPRAAELRRSLESAGILARGVRDAGDAGTVAAAWKPNLVLVDSVIESPSPQDIVTMVRAAEPSALCVIIVDAPSGSAVADALRYRADSVISWPIDVVSVRRLLPGEDANATLVRQPPQARSLELPAVAGSSPAMKEVWRLAFLAAQTQASLLIGGETGVGKEVVARAVHRLSSRRSGPFVAVNCAALPDTLLESELFGYERGAFTGAAQRRKGRFELAHGGTIFLDEIGDLPLALQAKLLRVLQERSFERLGSGEPVSVDIRVIAATHRDLEEEARSGRFRLDLYYRLNVLFINVPPLRERKEDILGLWDQMIEAGARADGRAVPRTSVAVQRHLIRHDWPGNVRELQNVAQHALTVATGEIITPADLPSRLVQPQSSTPHVSLVGMTMEEIERAAILQTYDALGAIDAAAEALGISPRTIQYRLRDYRRQGLLAERRPRRAEVQRPRRPSTPHVIRVLLAEDDDHLRWALADLLRAEGFEVQAVSDGSQALEVLTSKEPDKQTLDVLVADVRMPGISGIELLEAARAQGMQLPVVVMSAFGDVDTRERALALGAAAFLDKPVAVTDLQRVIRTATH